jgi:hypothetical protein
MILLDSGAEVSVINVIITYELRLLISTNIDLGIIQAKAPRTRFVGIVEDVPIAISRAEYKILI